MRAYFIYIKEARNLWDLASFLLSGKTTSYEYDINGRRTKKVANGVTTEYYYSGEQYTGMHTSDGKDVGAILDASGGLYGIYYDDSTIGTDVGQTYYFVYNGQGDVIGLYNHGGKLIATYAYDAWGRCIEAKAVTADDDGHAVTDPDHIAFINPFRYRGYMYDAESGLYYLGSRYYDPETGRFINADAFASTGQGLLGHNMFAYCQNNPSNHIDIEGYFIGALIGGAIGAVGGLIGGGISAAIKGEDVLAGMASGALGGAVGGAISGGIVDAVTWLAPVALPTAGAVAVGVVAGAVGGAVSSAVNQSSNYYFNNGSLEGFEMNMNEVGMSAAVGGVFGGLGEGFGASISKYYDDALVGAGASGIWTAGNAAADIATGITNSVFPSKTDKDKYIKSPTIKPKMFFDNKTGRYL